MTDPKGELVFKDIDNGELVAENAKIVERSFINETDQESICGVDNRIKITSTMSLPYKAICKLYMTADDGDVYVGTGWLTHSNKLYTAGHNLHNIGEGGWMKSITVVPGMSGLLEPFGRYRAVSMMTTTGWVEEKNRRFDMGAIKLASDVEHTEYLVPYMVDAQRASVCGYSADRDTGLFQYAGEDLVRNESGQFHYRIDTFGGASGSPLLIDGVRSIGIHNYGGCDNTGSDLYQEFIDGVESW